jgi:hypothetical protein
MSKNNHGRFCLNGIIESDDNPEILSDVSSRDELPGKYFAPSEALALTGLRLEILHCRKL